MLWVPKRTVLLRRFFWVPTTYVLVKKWKELFSSMHSCLGAWYMILNICKQINGLAISFFLLLHVKLISLTLNHTYWVLFDSKCMYHVWIQKSFVRGGPTLTMFFFKLIGGSEYHYKRAIISPPAKQRFVGVPMMAQHWMLAWWLCNFPGFADQSC